MPAALGPKCRPSCARTAPWLSPRQACTSASSAASAADQPAASLLRGSRSRRDGDGRLPAAAIDSNSGDRRENPRGSRARRRCAPASARPASARGAERPCPRARPADGPSWKGTHSPRGGREVSMCGRTRPIVVVAMPCASIRLASALTARVQKGQTGQSRMASMPSCLAARGDGVDGCAHGGGIGRAHDGEMHRRERGR